MEEFVSYELAKRLKDLGYNTPFFFFYRTDDKLIHHAMVSNPLVYGKDVDDEVVAAPTISQVLKWLREEKGIHITICVCGDGWFYEVINISSGKSLVEDYEDDMVQSYEECVLAGIEYCLDNLI